MLPFDKLPGRTALIEGQEYLYFSGTSYLGMVQHPEFLNLVKEGLTRFGTNFGGSRLSNMQLSIFEEAEHFLATFTGASAALSVSSGSLAGQLIVRYFENSGRPLFYAPGTHPALWGKGAYGSSDYTSWTREILRYAQEREEELVLFCNSVDPLRVELFDFQWLKDLPTDKKTTLVIDDSHGIGVLGPSGAGIYAMLPQLEQLEVVVIASLGKALGVPGGVILGSPSFINMLWQSPYFGGASPCLPAYLHAMLGAKDLYQQAWKRLMANIMFLQQQPVMGQLFNSLDAYPVFYTKQDRIATYLKERGILISSFSYPTPADDCITRLVVSAAHEREDLEGIIGRMSEWEDK